MPARKITFKGKTYPSRRALAVAFGKPYSQVQRRLSAGYSIEQAIDQSPLNKRTAHNGVSITIANKHFESLRKAAQHFGIAESAFRRRLELNWSPEQAAGLKQPPKRQSSYAKPVKFLGVDYPSATAMNAAFGFQSSVIEKRISRGWTEREAAGLDPKPHRHRNIDGSPRQTNLANFEEIDGKTYPKAAEGQYKLYLITNIENKKEYVGITVSNLEQRLGQHIYAAENSDRPQILYRAIRKYGSEKFKISLLRDDAKNYQELMQQEYGEIQSRNLVKRGYNSSRGGDVGTGKEIKIDGRVFATQGAAADFYGIEQTKFNWRLRNRYTPEQAAGLEPWDGAGPKPIIVKGKQFRSIQAAAKRYGVSPQLAAQRVRGGWSAEQAMALEGPPDYHSKPIAISFGDNFFDNQKAFCEAANVSDALVLKRRKEGWTYQQIWDEYANGGRARICPACGTTFKSMRRDTIYCSRKCISRGRYVKDKKLK